MQSVRNSLIAACVLTAVAGAQHWVLDVPGNFLDLTTTGGAVIATTDDSTHSFVTTVGNAAWPAGQMRLGNNGAVANTGATVSAGAVSLTNAVIAGAGSTAIPAGMPAGTIAALMPFWDDLDPLTAGGTTVAWQEISGILYIMWKNESHYADAAGAVITFEIVVFPSPVNPCDPIIQLIYPDTAFGGVHAANDNGASATVGFVAGTLGGGLVNVPFSFNTASLSSGMVLTLVAGPAVGSTTFGAVLTSPSGPGSVQIDFGGAGLFCFGATYFMPVNFALEFPQWFYGLGITFPALAAEFNAGFPYVGQVGSTIGPITGLPSGLQVWGTTVGWPNFVAPAPVVVGPGWTYIIP